MAVIRILLNVYNRLTPEEQEECYREAAGDDPAA